jgi:hypothetical protein
MDPVYIDPTPLSATSPSSSHTLVGLVALIIPVAGFVYYLRTEKGRKLAGRMAGFLGYQPHRR